jgi:multidrug efflux system membrane fusion protein
MRKMSISNVVCAVAAASLAAACTKAQGVEPKPARPVRVQAVEPAPPQSAIRYSASIEPFEQVTLSFKSSGYIDDLLRRPGADGRLRTAQAGDRVAKGTVLARVREADYRERVEQGRARLAENDAALRKARLDLDRATNLFASDSLTKPELDSAQASFDGAQARVVATHTDIALALIALQDCELTSPANGILLERRVEVGTLVAAGTVGYVMGDIGSVKARFGIPDAVIQSVKLGDPLGITVEAIGAAALNGRVTAISPTADPHSRVFDVEVTIPNQDGRLRPGMIGTVAIGGAPAAAAAPPLTLPLSAIVRSGTDRQQYAVLVVEGQGADTIARLRRVELGDVMGNGVAVRSGVAHGDRVVTSGATLLADGDPVRIIP